MKYNDLYRDISERTKGDTYIGVEERVVRELKAINKPFVIL